MPAIVSPKRIEEKGCYLLDTCNFFGINVFYNPIEVQTAFVQMDKFSISPTPQDVVFPMVLSLVIKMFVLHLFFGVSNYRVIHFVHIVLLQLDIQLLLKFLI